MAIIGSVIETRWRVVDDLCGQGGQGKVYKVVDTSDESKEYALKYLLSQNDVERRMRVYNEVKNAELIADRLLTRMSETDWRTYLEMYLKEETDLVDYINNCNAMRNKWKSVVQEYHLEKLGVTDGVATQLTSIAK